MDKKYPMNGPNWDIVKYLELHGNDMHMTPFSNDIDNSRGDKIEVARKR